MPPITSSLVSASSSTPTFTLSPAKTFTCKALILRHFLPLPLSLSRNTLSCTFRDSPTQKHVYTHSSPAEFAESETGRFKVELFQKLSDDVDEFGDDLDAVIDVCSQIFSEFLHNEYEGPGTLLVEPFTDMLVALKKKKLPGAPLAARASLLWAQKYVDEDWNLWNSRQK